MWTVCFHLRTSSIIKLLPKQLLVSKFTYYSFRPCKLPKFLLIVLKVALLKEAAAKKDAEISNLQTFKERFERAESGVLVEKFKSRPSKPIARLRASIDTTAAQKVRIVQNEVGSGAVEVCFALCR